LTYVSRLWEVVGTLMFAIITPSSIIKCYHSSADEVLLLRRLLHVSTVALALRRRLSALGRYTTYRHKTLGRWADEHP